MRLRRPNTSAVRGFTLIEILVICALIALLSGIAIINVQEVMRQTRIKSTYADARGVADALVNAYEDVGLYPKLGFLTAPISQLPRYSSTQDAFPEDFEANGFVTNSFANPLRLNQINDQWRGPYFNSATGSSTRKAGNRGYYAKMALPSATSAPLLDWPADPWGNPYVVYLIHQDKPSYDPVSNTYGPTPIPRFVRSPYEEANYFAAIVSYGPNGIPGGSADTSFTPPGVLTEGYKWRLFSTQGGTPAMPNNFLALRSDQVPLLADGVTSRVLSLSMNAPFGYMNNPKVPGILDGTFNYIPSSGAPTPILGSDDIVVMLR